MSTAKGRERRWRIFSTFPFGKKEWRRAVDDVVSRLKAALVADYVVLGGGKAKKLQQLPEGARLGDNAHAFLGWQRLWEERGICS